MHGAPQTRFDFSEQSPVHAVVTAVAAREDADPCDLPPLERAIDTDALENLLTSSGRRSGDRRVTFAYCGYAVTVRSSGNVTVDGGADRLADERDGRPVDDANGHRSGGD